MELRNLDLQRCAGEYVMHCMRRIWQQECRNIPDHTDVGGKNGRNIFIRYIKKSFGQQHGCGYCIRIFEAFAV